RSQRMGVKSERFSDATSFFTWLPYYATKTLPEGLAGVTLSVYLAAYVPGRLAFSRVTERYRFSDLLVVATIVLSVTVYAAFVLADGLALLALIFVVGFFVSGLFPTLISLGVESAPSFTGPVNAVANIAAQTGFFTVPAVIGFVSQGSSIQRAMLLQVGLAGALTAVVVALKLGPLGVHEGSPDAA
ncbi:MAG: sugar MFS transporter, partial [Haloarculaceae archaeon]